MVDSPRSRGRLLPKGWPRRVRSALVHAISMSNVVFDVTRSHAENHFNARVRLQAENDRLRPEVALLAEELRIKDVRMLSLAVVERFIRVVMSYSEGTESKTAGWSAATEQSNNRS